MSKALIESITFRLFFFCLTLDLIFQPNPQNASAESSQSDVPSSYSKASEPSSEETFNDYRQTQSNIVEILYCSSGSYKNNFQEIKEFIQTNFPDLEVIGGEYPPPTLNKLLSRFCSGLQIAFFILMIAGEKIFHNLGIPESRIFQLLKEKKMMVLFFIFVLGNSLSNYFWSSGAFEIMFRDNLVFSKLRMGNMPDISEILERIKEIRG